MQGWDNYLYILYYGQIMIIAEKGKIVVMGVTNLMHTKIKTNVHIIVSKYLLKEVSSSIDFGPSF